MNRRDSYPIWSTFLPQRGGSSPLHAQLVKFFREAIANGALKPGRRIPASRILAKELGLARNTVTLAYEHLTAEGFLQTKPGSGTFVLERLPHPPRDRR